MTEPLYLLHNVGSRALCRVLSVRINPYDDERACELVLLCRYTQVTHAFPFPAAVTGPDGQALPEDMDGHEYQMEMMKMLREVSMAPIRRISQLRVALMGKSMSIWRP